MKSRGRVISQVTMALMLTGVMVNLVVAEELAAKTEKKKVAYLGVGTKPVSATLKKQLDLSNGAGLVVESIAAGSPAAEKLQVDDILRELNSQFLFNHAQLAALVQSLKPGDEAKISLIRGGKPELVGLKLGEKEVSDDDGAAAWNEPIVHIAPPVVSFLGAGADGDKIAKQVQALLEKHMKKSGGAVMLNMDGGDSNGLNIAAAISNMMPGIQAEVQKAMKEIEAEKTGAGDATSVSTTVSSHVCSVSSSDDDGSATLSEANGVKTLTVHDKQGKTVFDGPVTTDEQRKVLAENVLTILKKLEKQAAKADVKVHVSKKKVN